MIRRGATWGEIATIIVGLMCFVAACEVGIWWLQ